jgi:hypothetical protein
MGTLIELPNITFDSLVVETPNKVTEKKMSAFDAKNYLNTRLADGETEKTLTIRLLPMDLTTGNPFAIIHTHNVKVPQSLVKPGEKPFKTYICLSKTDGVDHDKFGNKCPFCELNREAYKYFTEETDPVAKERWKKISLDNIPKEACIVRCIERGYEEDGPKFWKFNTRKDKTDPKGQIMELYKTRLEESREEGMGEENILDIHTGKDLKVVISIAADNKAGENRTSVKVLDCGKNKPLSLNEEEINAWVNDDKKWSDVFAVKPYDYLKIIIDGQVPFYDKNIQRWVTKVEHLNNINELSAEADSIIDDAEQAILSTPTDYECNNAVVVNGVEEELPF